MSHIQRPTVLTFYLYNLENGPTLRADSTPPKRICFEVTPRLQETLGLFDRLVALADAPTLKILEILKNQPGMKEHFTACSLMIPPELLPKESGLSENHIYNSELALSRLLQNGQDYKYGPTRFLLSFLYLNGIGVEQNILYSTSLIKWASHEFLPAKYALGYGLYLGVHGFEKNEIQGRSILSSCHSEKSQTALEIISRELSLEPMPFPYPQPLQGQFVKDQAMETPQEINRYEQLLLKMEQMEATLNELKKQNALLLEMVRGLSHQY